MSTCLVPFNQLYIHSSGDVYPCAFLQNNREYVLGNIQKKKLKDIWEGKSAEKLRKDHLGQIPYHCDKNQSTFLCNKTSLRGHFNMQELKVKRLDVMLDSACNLTCVMCTNIYDKTGGFKDQFFWENNDDILSDLEELELVGGEPLISPYFFKMVDRVTNVNSKCEWRITTNAHFPITEKLKTDFKRIKLKTLSISLDSLDAKIFEGIRGRSQFQIVYDNIFVLKDLVPTIQINMVVQDTNFHELSSMHEWTTNHGFKFHPILLVNPEKHSLSQIPKDVAKAWLVKSMKENNQFKSKEIFFLLKKSMTLFGLHKDLEVKDAYLTQLQTIGGEGE